MEVQTDTPQLTTHEWQAIHTFTHRLQQQFGNQVLSVILFGSRTRGEARPDSDMDVAVIVAQDDPEIRKAIRYLAVEIWLEYELYLSTRVWSQAHWHHLEFLQTSLYRNLQQEGFKVL